LAKHCYKHEVLNGSAICCGFQNVQGSKDLGGNSDDACLLSKFAYGSFFNAFAKFDFSSREAPKSGIWGIRPANKDHRFVSKNHRNYRGNWRLVVFGHTQHVG